MKLFELILSVVIWVSIWGIIDITIIKISEQLSDKNIERNQMIMYFILVIAVILIQQQYNLKLW